MRGFLVLAGVYAALWALLLVPGAYVLLRRTGATPIPDDDPSSDRWVVRLRRELIRRTQGVVVAPVDVPMLDAGKKGLRPAEEALRVSRRLDVPDGAAVAVGLIVDGDLHCGPGAHLLAPVWVRGRAVLADGCRATSLVADRGLILGPDVRLDGNAASRGRVLLEQGAQVSGTVVSRRAVVLSPGSIAGAAAAPSVRCGPLDPDIDVAPPCDVEPYTPVDWTDELDDALDDVWPEGRLDELVEEIEERTGTRVRARDVLRRARELDLITRGVPRRPGFLGRRPAWVLTPEVVRVGADLRIPREERVGYSLVVEGALEVFHEAELEAPVRTGRGLLLHPGAAIHGSAVSDGLIVCEEGSAVLGPADSSMHILLFSNARIGTPEQGGAHARGAIGLEPGAEIIGGAVAGLGVRGEAIRPQELRGEQETEPEEQPRPARRRRRRRGRPKAAEAEADGSSEVMEQPPPKEPPKKKRRRRRRRRRRRPPAKKTEDAGT